MGSVDLVPGLEMMVARMIEPKVRKIAKRVEATARRLAPPTKRWVSMADNRVRDTHRTAHGLHELPGNLRFAVPGQPWDIEHGLSPGVDYLLAPKDTSTGLPKDSVQHVHCRCVLALNPAGIASRISTAVSEVGPTGVRIVVSCSAYKVIQAEYGETYPTGLRAAGTHFMARAAERVAGTGGYGPVVDPNAAQTGGPGNGSHNQGGADSDPDVETAAQAAQDAADMLAEAGYGPDDL